MVVSADGLALPLTDDGFLCDASDWTPLIAAQLAALEAIMLTDAHWEILHFVRQYYQDYKHLPNARMFAAALRKQLGPDKASSRYLQHLFPHSPLKYACKIAGLPKPPFCL